MPVNSRAKGKRNEREAAALAAELWPGARRGLTQSRGAEQADVEGTPTWLEVKSGRRPNHRAALTQAERDTDGRPCLVLAKDDGAGQRPARWHVVTTWRDFRRIIEAERREAAAAAVDAMGSADLDGLARWEMT